MWQDPIVAEVRRAREEHARQFFYDLQVIYDALKEQEEGAVCSKVSLSPKRIPPVKDTKQDPAA